MGRGDFQGSAGKVSPAMRRCAMPNRVLQGRQFSWVLLQNTHGSTVLLPRVKAPMGGGATRTFAVGVHETEAEEREEKRRFGAKCWFKRG